jgi:hypothetical protein
MSDEQNAPGTDTAPEKVGNGGSQHVFTQEQVDAIVGERAKRAAEAAVHKLLEQLGVAGVDDLKAQLEEARQRREAEMSEAQKAAAEAERARKERDALKAELEAERQQRIVDKRNSRLVTAAQRAGMEAPDDIVVWAQTYAATALSAVVDESGAVSEQAVDKLVAACKNARPNWFRSSAPGAPSNADGRVIKPDASKLLEGLPKLRL